jgi:hypothetical protein
MARQRGWHDQRLSGSCPRLHPGPQGFFATLEMLPMWSGMAPDVELYASGVVVEDSGDWEFAGEGGGVGVRVPPCRV